MARHYAIVAVAVAMCAMCAGAIEMAVPQNVPPLFAPGARPRDGEAWRNGRREEIKKLLETEVYGKRPVERPPHLAFSAVEPDAVMMDGAAVRKRVRVEYGGAFWYCRRYIHWTNRDMETPFDQHMLVALIAPRLVCIGSATEDDYAGPYGEYQTARYASPAWRIFGKKGFVSEGFPAPDAPQQEGDISYHIRTGKHDLTLYDWGVYMDFADQHGWTGRAGAPGRLAPNPHASGTPSSSRRAPQGDATNN